MNPAKQKYVVDVLILSTIVCIFSLFKSYSLNPYVSDSNIYFYDAWLMANGHIPYRDFFFAHPVFHLIPGWIMMMITSEFNLNAMKMIPSTAAAATGIFLYLIVLRVVNRRGAAVASILLFLFSYDLLRASSHWTGINLSLCWMTLAFLLAVVQKHKACGIVLGISISTGIYTLPGAMIILGSVFVKKPLHGFYCIVTAFLAVIAINLPFLLWGGKGFIDGVFLFHFLKSTLQGGSFLDQIDHLLFHNFFVLSAPLYLLPVLVIQIKKIKPENRIDFLNLFKLSGNSFISTGLWCLIAWIVYILFLMSLKRVYHYYFLLVFPFSIVCAGLFISTFFENLKICLKKRSALYQTLFFSMLIIAGGFVYPFFEQLLPYYQKQKGQIKQYSFPISPLPTSLQIPVRLLWNSDRKVGKRYAGIQYYLWHETRVFSEAEQIVDVLKTYANKGDRLFGDSTSTPLIALFSHLMIFDNFVDTNTMRFKAALPNLESLISKLLAANTSKKNKVNWILINPAKGVGRLTVFKQFLKKNYTPFKYFKTRYSGTYILMKLKITPTIQ
ncbi:MAG: hypothetical protein GY699_17050 [Desulfobacteraceae bacterium]|nr:hypothetical protein [Desulfobacteraceae bacterium]